MGESTRNTACILLKCHVSTNSGVFWAVHTRATSEWRLNQEAATEVQPLTKGLLTRINVQPIKYTCSQGGTLFMATNKWRLICDGPRDQRNWNCAKNSRSTQSTLHASKYDVSFALRHVAAKTTSGRLVEGHLLTVTQISADFY